MEDPRKIGLKNGLRQLTVDQLQSVLDWPYEMILDEYNYSQGKFCPLAVAIGIPDMIEEPNHEKVYNMLIGMGYKVYNTRGIVGTFYRENRKDDLIEATIEVIEEKKNLLRCVG